MDSGLEQFPSAPPESPSPGLGISVLGAVTGAGLPCRLASPLPECLGRWAAQPTFQNRMNPRVSGEVPAVTVWNPLLRTMGLTLVPFLHSFPVGNRAGPALCGWAGGWGQEEARVGHACSPDSLGLLTQKHSGW